ncbi:MAG: hypothetical protein QHH07_04795 [Sedimentisphaerales bacterium]|nr:hypothetical protein [Sedimentisphaerales bacterium]
MLVTALLTGGCKAKSDKKPVSQRRIPVVSVEQVTEGPIMELLDLTGQTIPVEQVLIASLVEGPITYCPWREGDEVQS